MELYYSTYYGTLVSTYSTVTVPYTYGTEGRVEDTVVFDRTYSNSEILYGVAYSTF